MLPNSSETYSFFLPTFKELLDMLDAEMRPRVLVNTFDALEGDALKAIDGYELISMGPLVKDTSFRGDIFEKSDDYIEWLNSKPQALVVYVSFGSLLRLPKPQMEEIGKGLLEANRPFLWVMLENKEGEGEKLSCLEELEKMGKIVPWCSQLEVLRHPSLRCFVTHCGWNLTLESLSCGVLVVAYLSWSDQGMNAKLIEDVWRVNVNGEGVVKSGEIRRCIEQVMDGGVKCRELRKSAHKWKGLAREAVGENGSSSKNLMAFFG